MNSITLLDKTKLYNEQLRTRGWLLLRGECLDSRQFDLLLAKFLRKMTFDPARRAASENTQMVDSGTSAIGLHIENGNTPLPPDVVAFHCVKAAKEGSETTVCDGMELWQHLPSHLQSLFSQPITVRRTLDPVIWKRYVASAVGRSDHSLISAQDLHRFLNQIPGQKGELHKDGSLDYSLSIDAVRQDNFQERKAFANALMGPSFNYQAPRYFSADGKLIGQSVVDEIAKLSVPFTQNIQWKDGDVLLIDNKRVMHGRREIVGAACERIINIGMGMRL